ncbi:MAG: hypothetical protein IJY94_02415 [Clostridia bacterium]|nr:hypothetical protein [Clostridia bacterium]
MSFVIGFAIGCALTLYLVYRAGKKKAAALQKKVNNPEGSDKNLYEGDEDY